MNHDHRGQALLAIADLLEQFQQQGIGKMEAVMALCTSVAAMNVDIACGNIEAMESTLPVLLGFIEAEQKAAIRRLPEIIEAAREGRCAKGVMFN